MYSKEYILPMIIVLSAAIATGISSFAFLNSLVSDLLIPLFFMVLKAIFKTANLDQYGSSMDLVKFVSSLIVYVVILFSVWIMYALVVRVFKKKEEFSLGSFILPEQEMEGFEEGNAPVSMPTSDVKYNPLINVSEEGFDPNIMNVDESDDVLPGRESDPYGNYANYGM
jgi:large-conductance mechanosensitive channel